MDWRNKLYIDQNISFCTYYFFLYNTLCDTVTNYKLQKAVYMKWLSIESCFLEPKFFSPVLNRRIWRLRFHMDWILQKAFHLAFADIPPEWAHASEFWVGHEPLKCLFWHRKSCPGKCVDIIMKQATFHSTSILAKFTLTT
jgi:hypothetical protein